jgi:hypothetical protein
MELIHRYVHEVGRRLPSKIRQDVQNELTSLLSDSVEERLGENPTASREDVAAQVLRDFGKPDVVARRYNSQPDYLIGPRWFPAFVLTARVVLGVVALLFIIPIGVNIAVHPDRVLDSLMPRALLSLAGDFTRAAVANLAMLVMVFAILERLPLSPELKQADWDPRSLPRVDDPDRISMPGRVARIYALFALIVLLGFFPQWFGIVSVVGGDVNIVDFGTLGFRVPELALQLWWAAAIVMNVALLRAGRWTRATRWSEFALGLLGCGIVYHILTQSGRPDLTPQFVMERWPSIDAGSAAPLARLLSIMTWMAYASLGIGLVAALARAGVRLQRLVTRYGIRATEHGAHARA